jgi:hypothetical protein
MTFLTFTQTEHGDKNLPGVASQIFTFERDNKTFAAVGYTNGTVFIYEPEMDKNSPNFMAPKNINDPEKCNIQILKNLKDLKKEELKTACSLSVDQNEKLIGAEIFKPSVTVGTDARGSARNAPVTALTYVPEVKDGLISKSNGYLIIGLGKTTNVTPRISFH